MKYLYLILIFLLCIFNFFYVSNTQLYTRIPKHEVKYVVWDFLSDNQINNCFQYELHDTVLLLKCWIEDRLKTVEIRVQNEYLSITV